MATTIDYSGATFRIIIPLADLTILDAGPPVLYELDTDALLDDLKALEAAEDGMAYQDTQSHNGQYTVFGDTFAQKIEILNATNSSNVDVYEIFFSPDVTASVKLTGSNNNVADLQNAILANTVTQVIPTNSAGLIHGALTAADLDQFFTRIMENGETYEEGFRLIRANAAGSIRRAGDVHRVRNAADDKDRITATATAADRDVTSVDGT